MDPHRKQPPAVSIVLCVAFLGVLGTLYWQIRTAQQRRADAKAQCERWAADLDGRTTPVGAYIRHDGDTLPEADPWGTDLRVAYSAGGLAEKLEVRSCGPDRVAFTDDDIVAWRLSANSRNIAEGTLRAAGKLAAGGAKSFGKGAVEAAKDKLGVGKPAD